MSKLVSLILVVALLFSAVLPAWAGSPPAIAGDDNVTLVSAAPIHLMGGCEDGSASSCDHG